jgi:class 3 adenylate cyclase
MLFADAVGYSKLSEDQIPLFVDQFLAPIGRLIEESDVSPILKESTGDGLYFVFESVREAGIFGLALQDLIADVDWEARGLPASMTLRIALHCGPVHSILDPITGQKKYTGPHTSRAARIEPITPPGQVYASEAFAALAASFGVTEFTFEYVGRTALAKKYGSLGLYLVRRAGA